MTETRHHQDSSRQSSTPGPAVAGHRGHGWMMILCCIPMLIIAIALVVTGVVSATFLVFAVLCTVVMALMMGGMHGGHDESTRSGAPHDEEHQAPR